MEWIDCKGMTNKELEEVWYQHQKTSGNRTLFMYGDGSIQHGCVLYSAEAPVKYLLTRAHPNKHMIAEYISAMRPVYLDGLETRDPMAAMDTPSSERLSFHPPKKTATIKYRQYLCQSVDGEIQRQVVNHGSCAHMSALEFGFIRWIDDDWVTEEVEL